MDDSEPIQCPSCGWTGYAEDLDSPSEYERTCPICAETVEFID